MSVFTKMIETDRNDLYGTVLEKRGFDEFFDVCFYENYRNGSKRSIWIYKAL